LLRTTISGSSTIVVAYQSPGSGTWSTRPTHSHSWAKIASFSKA
jgi:hypothetical protein